MRLFAHPVVAVRRSIAIISIYFFRWTDDSRHGRWVIRTIGGSRRGPICREDREKIIFVSD